MSLVISKALIMAIIAIESGGDDFAVGDNGASVGCMQISEAVISDVNEVSPVKYTLDDRLDREKSIEIFRAYIARYCTEERLGRKPTEQDAARIWVSGPNGYKKSASLAYWRKVEGAMP